MKGKKMSPVLVVLLERLSANGNDMLYNDLVEPLDYLQRQAVPNAIIEGKSLGVIARENIYDPDTKATAFHVKKVG